VVGAASSSGQRVSVHLVGGGWPDNSGDLYEGFLEESAARGEAAGRTVPRIGLLLVRDDAPARAVEFEALLMSVAACDVVATAIAEGELFTPDALSDIDGLLIGGGLTPAYFDAVSPIVDEIRLLVGDGLPYLGFSAGAAIAADTAIIGGWQIDGIPVCSEDVGEDFDDVTVVEGLGLIDLAVDVHAAQWGTLTRLIAATEAGLVDGGIAIDEFTALIIGDDALDVVGRGSVWRVTPSDDGVVVSSLGA
jgi:cyanophycinase